MANNTITITLETLLWTIQDAMTRQSLLDIERGMLRELHYQNIWHNGVWYRVEVKWANEEDEALPQLADPQTPVLLSPCSEAEVQALRAQFGEVIGKIERAYPLVFPPAGAQE